MTQFPSLVHDLVPDKMIRSESLNILKTVDAANSITLKWIFKPEISGSSNGKYFRVFICVTKLLSRKVVAIYASNNQLWELSFHWQ